MLQSTGSQRVGHDLATEQLQQQYQKKAIKNGCTVQQGDDSS